MGLGLTAAVGGLSAGLLLAVGGGTAKTNKAEIRRRSAEDRGNRGNHQRKTYLAFSARRKVVEHSTRGRKEKPVSTNVILPLSHSISLFAQAATARTSLTEGLWSAVAGVVLDGA